MINSQISCIVPVNKPSDQRWRKHFQISKQSNTVKTGQEKRWVNELVKKRYDVAANCHVTWSEVRQNKNRLIEDIVNFIHELASRDKNDLSICVQR